MKLEGQRNKEGQGSYVIGALAFTELNSTSSKRKEEEQISCCNNLECLIINAIDIGRLALSIDRDMG